MFKNLWKQSLKSTLCIINHEEEELKIIYNASQRLNPIQWGPRFANDFYFKPGTNEGLSGIHFISLKKFVFLWRKNDERLRSIMVFYVQFTCVYIRSQINWIASLFLKWRAISVKNRIYETRQFCQLLSKADSCLALRNDEPREGCWIRRLPAIGRWNSVPVNAGILRHFSLVPT